MDVKFTVFVADPQDSHYGNLLKTFTNLGYVALADGINYKNYNWYQKNIKVGRLFIFDKDELFMFTVDNLDSEMIWLPDFAITFNDDALITEEQWDEIHLYCKQHLTNDVIDMTNTMKVHELLGKPTSMTASIEDTPMLEADQDYYGFNRCYLDQQDIMLYEVTKPHTDLPYTSVTKNYSKKGHLPFFTDLFICQSWGVARDDIAFLKEMWKELNMEGDFDIETLMKNATEKCMPKDDQLPEPEPEVYRRSLNDTILILKEKALGTNRRIVPDFIRNKNH